jgi:hypothetical protein
VSSPREATNRLNSQARQRAYRRLADLHTEEHGRLLHEEKHRVGYPHMHSPADPETIDGWGEPAP